MSPRSPVRENGPKAERTRTEILKAAERIFAESGYAAARLQDVALQAGLRRASIVYYFREKRDLYDAVLSDIFGELLERYQAALRAPVSLPQRIEAVVDAWVDFVSERPTVARLLLWEAADGSPQRAEAARGHGASVSRRSATQSGKDSGRACSTRSIPSTSSSPSSARPCSSSRPLRASFPTGLLTRSAPNSSKPIATSCWGSPAACSAPATARRAARRPWHRRWRRRSMHRTRISAATNILEEQS